MAEPAGKAEELNSMLDSISKAVFGRERTTSIQSDICVTCGKPATTFKDELSRKEYSISGMCQECQDLVFNSDDEEG